MRKLIADHLRTSMDKSTISTGNRTYGNDLSRVIEAFTGKPIYSSKYVLVLPL